MARPHDAPQPISKAELLLRLAPLPEQIVVWDERGRLLQSDAGFARTDITERRQYEQDLQRMNEQLEARVQDRTRDLRHANRAPQPARAAANAAKSLFLATLQDCLARWLPAPAGHALRQAGGT